MESAESRAFTLSAVLPEDPAVACGSAVGSSDASEGADIGALEAVWYVELN